MTISPPPTPAEWHLARARMLGVPILHVCAQKKSRATTPTTTRPTSNNKEDIKTSPPGTGADLQPSEACSRQTLAEYTALPCIKHSLLSAFTLSHARALDVKSIVPEPPTQHQAPIHDTSSLLGGGNCFEASSRCIRGRSSPQPRRSDTDTNTQGTWTPLEEPASPSSSLAPKLALDLSSCDVSTADAGRPLAPDARRDRCVTAATALLLTRQHLYAHGSKLQGCRRV